MVISLDLGYIYRKGSYTDKKEAPFYYAELDYRSSDIYRMDRKNTFSGVSAGFSGLFKIYSRLSGGFNLYLNYGEAYQLFRLKQYVAGPKVNAVKPYYQNVNLPYDIESRSWRYGVTFLFKLAFRISGPA
jgi:hypothetical protein